MEDNFAFEAQMGVFYNPIFNLLSLLFPVPLTMNLREVEVTTTNVNQHLTIIKANDLIIGMNFHYATVLFPFRLWYGCNADHRLLINFLQTYLLRQGYFLSQYNQAPQYSIEIITNVQPHPQQKQWLITSLKDHFGVHQQVVTNDLQLKPGDVVVYAHIGAWTTAGSQVQRKRFGDYWSAGFFCSAQRLNVADKHQDSSKSVWHLPAKYKQYQHQAFFEVYYGHD